jgi:hypothetical protein
MRNSLFIFKPPNQREDIIDKCRECDKDRDTAPTRPNSVYPHHFSSHKKVADQGVSELGPVPEIILAQIYRPSSIPNPGPA